MLKFKYVHIYYNQANTLEFVDIIVPGVRKYFTNVTIGMRPPFLIDIDDVIADSLVSIRISDTKRPFNEQPEIKVHLKPNLNAAYEKNFPRHPILDGVSYNTTTTGRQYTELILYDGFMMQRLFDTMINENEANTDHVHIVFEDRLICTFSEEVLACRLCIQGFEWLPQCFVDCTQFEIPTLHLFPVSPICIHLKHRMAGVCFRYVVM